MRHIITAGAILAIALLGITGCSSSTPSTRSTVRAAASTPSPTATTPTQTPSPASTVAALGTRRQSAADEPGDFAYMTASKYTTRTAPNDGGGGDTANAEEVPAGTTIGLVYVTACLPTTAQGGTFSNQFWALDYPDGETVTPLSSYGNDIDWPGPFYAPMQPVDTNPGECRAGWIAFALTGHGKPSTVEYQDPNGAPIDWQLP
jgi:hypothetical protein